ncbi:MAG TPA: DUF4411 family protein [Stellaceae bacterium]|nr:DUF4411 family protein [Stellaceae bacterium]
MALPIYSVDSSALIHGWRRAYRPRNFGLVWARIDGLINEGRLRASIEVYREMERKDDELFAWCKERRAAMFEGRSGGDPFVIALAATARPPMTVITEESPGRQRIPDVCAGEGIPYIGLADLIEQENWQFG